MKFPAVSSTFAIVLLFAATWCGCDPEPPPSPSATTPQKAVTDETPAMVATLAQISATPNFLRNSYLNHRRSRHWKAFLASNPPPAEKARRLLSIVYDFIRSGDNRAALDLLNSVTVKTDLDEKERIDSQNELDLLKAIAWLRLGEQQNCIEHHSQESCILPIRGAGVHEQKEGSTKARNLLLGLLERKPTNLDALWLLNITAMTLGEYPGGVPKRFRIPETAFAAGDPFPRFHDVARDAGVDVNSLAGGGAVADFNNDHILDVVVSSWGLDDQTRLFIGRGDGSFAEQTTSAGLQGLTGGLNLVVADYNNDGFLDIFILRGAWMRIDGMHPNSLLRNNGDGTFSDVTRMAGLLSFNPTQTAVWFDYNSDGWLDLFIGNEPDGQKYLPSELYRNNADGTFTEVTAETGLAINRYLKGCASADYNNDGRPDLYLSSYDSPNLLMRNDGQQPDGSWKFTNVAEAAGVDQPDYSFPCWFWDYNNDGWEDLFVAGYEMKGIGQLAMAYLGKNATNVVGPKVYRNNGNGKFEDVTEASGIEKCWLPMGVNYGDLDNDGFLDFYVGTGQPAMTFIMPNRMYRNNGDGSFGDVTAAGGFGHLQKGHAISFADYDNDGDQDVHVVMGGGYTGDVYMNALFQNPGTTNGWLKLKFTGKESNRAGIGARFHLILETPDGIRHVHRTVSTGGSFGCNPIRQEIGLGNAIAIKSLEVTWPATGIQQKHDGLALNSFYEIIEGRTSPQRIILPRKAASGSLE